MAFLEWLHSTGLATWIREADTIWAYPAILTLHTFGLAILVGASAAIDLRILGFAPYVPLAPMEEFFPIMWIGFWINAASGVLLFIAAATEKGTQFMFFLKLSFVLIGLIHVRLLRSSVFRNPVDLASGRVSLKGRILAASSLAAWLGAIVAGRLMAYVQAPL